eukprot:m.23349 g.23349  ORF g.23349 m.23349 type:complete len:359 (+) comp8967_c0_seq1:49-1125(+)
MSNMTMILEAKRQSEVDRADQLKAFNKFEKGETVVFKVHNDKKGYKIKKSDIKVKKHKKKRLIHFEPVEVIMDLIVEEDDDALEEYLDNHVDNIEDKDSDGMTPLHRACVENNIRIVKILLNSGANVNSRDKDWWTPLHAASSAGASRICMMLLRDGADVSLVNADDDLAIDLADDERTEAVLQRAMEEAGLTTNKEELMKKPQNDLLTEIKRKIRHGKPLNKPLNKEGATFFHIAACNGYEECLRTLLEAFPKGGDLKDKEGDTPLHLGAFFNEYNCVMMLCLVGANTNAVNMYNQRPIVMTEDPLMIKLLRSFDEQIPEFIPDDPDTQHIFSVGKAQKHYGSVRHRAKERLPVDAM